MIYISNLPGKASRTLVESREYQVSVFSWEDPEGVGGQGVQTPLCTVLSQGNNQSKEEGKYQ